MQTSKYIVAQNILPFAISSQINRRHIYILSYDPIESIGFFFSSFNVFILLFACFFVVLLLKIFDLFFMLFTKFRLSSLRTELHFVLCSLKACHIQIRWKQKIKTKNKKQRELVKTVSCRLHEELDKKGTIITENEKQEKKSKYYYFKVHSTFTETQQHHST